MYMLYTSESLLHCFRLLYYLLWIHFTSFSATFRGFHG